MFNDDWMREMGYLEEKKNTVKDLVNLESSLVTVQTEELVSHAIERMRNNKISQIPVKDANGFVGSVDESTLLNSFIKDKNIANKPIKEVMGAMYPVVNLTTSISEVSKLMTTDRQAVLVDLGSEKYGIVTKHDIINAI